MYCSNCSAQIETDERPCPKCSHVTRPANKSKWPVILIGCGGAIVLFFFCSIISAIAIPNLLNAIDRGKQKRTLADMRTIANAVDVYALDHKQFPTARDLEQLRRQIPEPTLPYTDGWTHPIEFVSDPTGYEIRSYGKDGIRDDGAPLGATVSFNADLIFQTGQFVQWPEGAQQ
ncbi:MAG: type II secretion system protein GspG [Acidobacteriota bacterium]|nr:type II secretion system protein GspG [Acidobacteriota bacterium]MDH3785365.1 type II secretion system protein GspG [Acidobacteriota bacterium]